MKSGQTKPLLACLLVVLVPAVLAEASAASETPCEGARSALPTIPLNDLLESVSKKSNKEFLVDRRVSADIVIGQLDWREITYPTLHSVLRNNELAAVTVQGMVNVVPVATVRQYPLPVLYEVDETIADDEWVTLVMRPKRATAAMFVPVLRPLLPQQGHLSAVSESNTLTIVARYANARRIAEMVQDMDEHTPESEGRAVPSPD